MTLKVGELMVLVGIDDGPMVKGIKQSSRKAEAEGAKVGDKAGEAISDEAGKATEKGGGKISGAMQKIGPALLAVGAVVGAAVGATLIAGVWAAIDREDLTARLASQLDATPEEAARYGALAGKIYADNFGASIDEVADAMQSVIQNIDGVGQAHDRVIERATKKALTFANVWNQDVAKATGAVGQMVRTGIAKDFDHAFDILAVGFSNGANKADDLLDTFNEYSVQFARMGISGEQALGMISQAVKAGARDADVAADALKEWAIKVREPMRESAGDIEGAARRVRDAQRSVVDSHRGVASAEQSLADTRHSTMVRMAEAARTTEQAERSLAQAQDNVRQKQQDLTNARREAADELRALSDQLTDAELSGRQSALSLERAQENLAKVMADPEASELQRKEAQLSVDQALRGLSTQSKRITELRQKKAEADAAGVEGSQRVADAQQAIVDAQDEVKSVEDRLFETRLAQVQASVDGQKSIEQSMDSVRSAIEGVQKAEESLADARKAAAEAAERPLTALGQAYKDIGLDGEKIQQMLNEGPEGQAKALQLVQDGLRGVADEAKRNELAALISGTMAEDMGDAFFAMDLATSTAADGLDNVAGASERAAQRLDTNKAKWESFRRGAMERLTNFIGEKVIPIMERLRDWIERNEGPVKVLAGVVGGVLLTAMTAYAISAAAAAAATVIAMAPFVAIAALVAALAAGFIWAYNNIDGFRIGIDKAVSFLRDTAWPVIQKVAGIIWDGLGGAARWVAGVWTDTLWPALKKIGAYIRDEVVPRFIAIKDTVAGVVLSVAEWFGSMVTFVSELPGKIKEKAAGMWDGIKEAFKSVINWIIRAWNSIGFKLPTIDLGPLGKVGGWEVGPKYGQGDLQERYHSGGKVPGRGERPAMVLGGEAVFTEQQQSGLRQALSILGMNASASLGAVGAGLAPVVPISSAPSARGQRGDTTNNYYVDVESPADPWKIAKATAFATAHSGVA